VKTIAKILVVLCIIVLILTTPVSLFAFNLGRTVFNVPLVKQILTDEVVNSNFIPIVLEWFSESRAQQRVDTGIALTGINEPDVILLMSYIDRDGWRRIKEEILTPEILIDWVSVTVDGFYNWIDSTDPTPQITFDLKSFIERVDSEHGANAILIAYEYLKPCTQEQIDDFKNRVQAAPAGSEVLYNLCEFPDPWHDDQIQDYVTSLEDVTANIPPSISLTQELAQLQDKQGIGSTALQQQLRTARFATRFSWLPPVVLLVILLLLYRTWRVCTRAGLPLFIGGSLSLLPTLIYRGTITRILSRGPLSEVPDVILTEASRALLRLLHEVFKPMLIQSAIIAGAGLLVIVISLIVGKKDQGEA
jgi:hypothetical protein